MSTRLKGSLGALAKNWAGQITHLAKGFAPNHLKNNISSKSVEIGEGRWSITTTAVGADAKAQEYGSGLRVKDNRRKKAKYLIKGNPFLLFKWDIADAAPPGKFKFDKKGRVILAQVMHPGIHPYNGQGYIAPAIKEIRKKARRELAPVVRKAILGDLNQAFKSGKR